MTQTATAPPTIHVVQIRDHMAGKRYGNGTCGAGGRTTWLGKGTETGHVVQREGPHGWKTVRKRKMWCRGMNHMAGKRYGNGKCGAGGRSRSPTKNPGKEPGLWSLEYYSVMFGSSRPRCFLRSTTLSRRPRSSAAIPRQASITRGAV